MFDLNNNLPSAVYQVLPPVPVVCTEQNNAGPGTGGTIVTQFGENLDLLGITGILVDGLPAAILALDPLGVTYKTPPNLPVPADGISDHGLVLHVRMIYDADDAPQPRSGARPNRPPPLPEASSSTPRRRTARPRRPMP